MTALGNAIQKIRSIPKRWLVTGVAGFIGSHLLELLLVEGQEVIGLDNFATGHRRNLQDVRERVGEVAWEHFTFVEGDIADLAKCQVAVRGCEVVLHQAALGSVPRSLDDPILSNKANVDGFLNMLVAARDAGVERFVYAASSSTYGDEPSLPKREEVIGKPLSPYAVTKYVNELYAQVFATTYGLSSIGLRYFNVFGPRQDPHGAYAAVIPNWIGRLMEGGRCMINGDGETSRDFCYVANAVQANILAATTVDEAAVDQVYNVAVGERTSLDELYELVRDGLAKRLPGKDIAALQPEYGPYRPGDVRHSLADVSKARELLGYEPTRTVEEGLDDTLDWFVAKTKPHAATRR